MLTGLFFVVLGVLILFYPQILVVILSAMLILFGLGMTPPPVPVPHLLQPAAPRRLPELPAG